MKSRGEGCGVEKVKYLGSRSSGWVAEMVLKSLGIVAGFEMERKMECLVKEEGV